MFVLHITWVCSPLSYIIHIIVTGEHISYRHLDYTPRAHNGITSSSSTHVMVAEFSPPAIYIHQLPGGETVRSIRRHELGLSKGDKLNGINFNGLLHLAVGDDDRIKSLHTYQVNTLSFQVAWPYQLVIIQTNVPH